MKREPKQRNVDVDAIMANPVYVGIGPFPMLVGEDDYIAAAKLMIEEQGPEHYLRQMIAALRASFDELEPEDR